MRHGVDTIGIGKKLNQRDTIVVRKMVGGFIKLLYPDGEYTKGQLEEILQLSLEMRHRVKEQLKKLGGMEFYDVNFSYIDNETFDEHYVPVPEQGGGKLIPQGMCNPGIVGFDLDVWQAWMQASWILAMDLGMLFNTAPEKRGTTVGGPENDLRSEVIGLL